MQHTPDQGQQPEEHVQQSEQAQLDSAQAEPTSVHSDPPDISASGLTSLNSQSGQPGPSPMSPEQAHSETIFSPQGSLEEQAGQPVPPPMQPSLPESQTQMSPASPQPDSSQRQAQIEPSAPTPSGGQPQALPPSASPAAAPQIVTAGVQMHAGQPALNNSPAQPEAQPIQPMTQSADAQPQVPIPPVQPVSEPIPASQSIQSQPVPPVTPPAPTVAPSQSVSPEPQPQPAEPQIHDVSSVPEAPGVLPGQPETQPTARPILRRPQPGTAAPNVAPAQPSQTTQRPTLQRSQPVQSKSGSTSSESGNRPQAADQQDAQSKVIMVVDDSQTVRNIMALILHRAGFRSVRVASAMEALHTLTELTPDLIFLDITLPGMDGLDVCKIIKENPRTKDVPVVMLSGNNEVFDKVMGRLAGASDYITKPFEPESILKCIQTFCGQKNRLREGLWQGAR